MNFQTLSRIRRSLVIRFISGILDLDYVNEDYDGHQDPAIREMWVSKDLKEAEQMKGQVGLLQIQIGSLQIARRALALPEKTSSDHFDNCWQQAQKEVH